MDEKINQIKCDCGKMIARISEDGKMIFLWCKSCKKEIPIQLKELDR